MYSPLHATAGLLLAQAAPNIPTAFILGVASHYLLDAIPHGDTEVGSWMTARHAGRRIAMVEVLDLGTASLVVAWLFVHHGSQFKLLAGALGGITPDLLWGAKYVLSSAKIRLPGVTWFLDWHQRWHSAVHAKKSYDLPFGVGLGYQIIVLAAILLLRV